MTLHTRSAGKQELQKQIIFIIDLSGNKKKRRIQFGYAAPRTIFYSAIGRTNNLLWPRASVKIPLGFTVSRYNEPFAAPIACIYWS